MNGGSNKSPKEKIERLKWFSEEFSKKKNPLETHLKTLVTLLKQQIILKQTYTSSVVTVDAQKNTWTKTLTQKQQELTKLLRDGKENCKKKSEQAAIDKCIDQVKMGQLPNLKHIKMLRRNIKKQKGNWAVLFDNLKNANKNITILEIEIEQINTKLLELEEPIKKINTRIEEIENKIKESEWVVVEP